MGSRCRVVFLSSLIPASRPEIRAPSFRSRVVFLVAPECRREFLMYVRKSHLLKNQTKYTIQVHLSGSFIHVVFLYITRITYKLQWNCDVLSEPTDFQTLAYNIHVRLLMLNQFTVLCGTKEALQY